MRIQHNVTAMNSYRNFNANSSSLAKNLEKLSSGYKINRAGDDAAGLAISEKMRAQITGIEGATKNSKDGISLIQTAEGALTEVHDMLNRMTTLAEQSANGTYQDELDREQLQKEVQSLKSEIDRIADSTNYNGLKLLDGSLGGAKEAQVSTLEGARMQSHVIDATQATTVATLGALEVNDTDKKVEYTEGAKYSLNVGLSDGTSTSLSLTVKKEGNDFHLVDDNGVSYGTLSSNKNEVLTDETHAPKLREAFVKLAKDSSLSDKFEIEGKTDDTDSKQKITFTAKEAGADGAAVTSVDIKVDLTNVASKTAGITGAAASGVSITDGKDKSMGFDATKLMAYNADARDGAGNANKAVFEVNGVKFAIGSYDQDLSNLGEDVNYISLVPEGTAGNEAFKMGLVTVSGGTDTESPDGFLVSTEGAKQIAHEISQKAGVNVTFESTAAAMKIDDGDTLAQGSKIFRVGDQPATEGKGLSLQIGDTSDSYNKLTVSVEDMHAAAIGVGDVDISTQEGASAALNKIKTAINMVSDTRGTLGALQNRLDHTINNLGVQRENIQNAESLIRDTDVAEEMMAYTKNNILNQSAQAMLAQANQLPQGVLQLLQ